MLEFSSNLEHTIPKKKNPLELWCLTSLEHTTQKNPPKLLYWAWTLEKIILQAWVCLLDRKSKEAGMKQNENKNSKIDGCPNLTSNKKPDWIFRKNLVRFWFSSHLEPTPGSGSSSTHKSNWPSGLLQFHTWPCALPVPVSQVPEPEFGFG
jgi:hypothetical protein